LANQIFVLNKYTKQNICSLPTASQLKEALRLSESSEARAQISMLFDSDTFVELGAYTKRAFSDFIATEKSSEFEGVICGYGAIDGKLVFAFVEDASRMGGAIDERHARKISDLYKMALNNGAPVIGIFNSNGTDIFEGTAGLAAYGRIMSCVTKASGVIPQIAYVAGNCIGTCAAIASMFDIVVKNEKASLYVSSPALTGENNAQDAIVSYCGSEEQCLGYIINLISFLPSNSSVGIQASEICTDNLNRKLGNLDFGGDALAIISVIADNGMFLELTHEYAPSISTFFATIGGVKCGVVASSYAQNEGRIDAGVARKTSKFVTLCDSFSIPVVTIVDSLGLAINKKNEQIFAPELAKLGMAYAASTCPKVTIILGHAIGASFVLLGSKSLGADLVYVTEESEIGALTAQSGVAFAWDKYITEENTREDLVAEWKLNVSSPANAAASGEIDDIISISELRARICSALLMLSAKGDSTAISRRKVLPL
jgi:acetyl-CoA carboxylase carboxyltransferase component